MSAGNGKPQVLLSPTPLALSLQLWTQTQPLVFRLFAGQELAQAEQQGMGWVSRPSFLFWRTHPMPTTGMCTQRQPGATCVLRGWILLPPQHRNLASSQLQAHWLQTYPALLRSTQVVRQWFFIAGPKYPAIQHLARTQAMEVRMGLSNI